MNMYFVGNDPLLIPLVSQAYLSFEHLRSIVNKGSVHIVVPHKNHPHHWIDMEGIYNNTNTFDANFEKRQRKSQYYC